MNVICKQSYPYGNDQNLIRLNIFQSGQTYTANINYNNGNEIWYKVLMYDDKFESFHSDEFDDYFISLAKTRKEKIKKINIKYE